MVRPDATATPWGGDHLLLHLARAGDTAAFASLYERHGPAVWRFLRDLFQDELTADEATQETFVRAHARLGTLPQGARLLAWLLGLAWELFQEARGRPPPATEEEGEDRLQAVLPTPSPEDLLLGGELEEVLGEALGVLDEEPRAALLLRLDHRLACEDIARVLGWPLARVSAQLHRARLGVRQRLACWVGAHR